MLRARESSAASPAHLFFSGRATDSRVCYDCWCAIRNRGRFGRPGARSGRVGERVASVSVVARAGGVHPPPRRAVVGEHRQRLLRRDAVLGGDVEACRRTAEPGVRPPRRQCVPVCRVAARAAVPRVAGLAARWPQLAVVGRRRHRVLPVDRHHCGRDRGRPAHRGRDVRASPASVAVLSLGAASALRHARTRVATERRWA